MSAPVDSEPLNQTNDSFRAQAVRLMEFLAVLDRKYDVLDMLRDLRDLFGCESAAVVSPPDAQGTRWQILCEPRDERSCRLVGRLLSTRAGDTGKYTPVGRLLEKKGFAGCHDRVTLAESGETTLYDIDLIPLPNPKGRAIRSHSSQVLVLVNAGLLTPDAPGAGHRSTERAIISELVRGWWMHFAAPLFWLHLDTPLDAGDREESYPDGLDTATIGELIRYGRRSAHWLHTQSQHSDFYFEGETEGRPFRWSNWRPRDWYWRSAGWYDHQSDAWCPASSSAWTVQDERQRAETLVYWCRWINAHNDLEVEWAEASASPANERPERGDRSTVSVREWVRTQRDKRETGVKSRIEDLRELAVRQFEHEVDDPCHPSTAEGDSRRLSISHKPLLSFSLAKWLDDGSWLRKDLAGDALSDVEFCRIMHSLAVTAHYALADESDSPDRDVIHRLMLLVARYGHDELGIPARVDLRAHLLHAARGEPALYALKHSYRDHFFHVLEVCFLGHVLLETELPSGQRLWQIVSQHLLQRDDKPMVLRLWYMAALLHDIGRAMDVLNSSWEYLSFFKHSGALRRLAESYGAAIRQLSQEQEVWRLGIISPGSGIERDHGIVGALHLRALLESIARTDRSVKPADYLPAVRAIALHNLRRPDHRIIFDRDPLAFLLALCDQLQEWRRPRFSYATSPNLILSKLGGALQAPDEPRDALRQITTNLQVRTDEHNGIWMGLDRTIGQPPGLDFWLEYDEQINTFSRVFYVWLDATLNFQRMDLHGLPLDMRVHYVTPQYRPKGSRSGTPQRQLHRLRDAAFETHMTFLSEWFPSEGNTAVRYRSIEDASDSKQRREVLTLDLKALSGRARMTRQLDAFTECLEQWKHYRDDQQFPGDYAVPTPE